MIDLAILTATAWVDAPDSEVKLAVLLAVVPLLPRCEAYGGFAGESDCPAWTCDKPATRSGNCDPHDSLCCDEHKCRHKCPDLPYAEAVRYVDRVSQFTAANPVCGGYGCVLPRGHEGNCDFHWTTNV